MSKRFFTISDLEHLPEPQWLIDGMFDINSLVMLAGPSESYKSFLALDWTLSMATHRKWNNKPTRPAKVVYVLGEGRASLFKRIGAWIQYHQLNATERQLVEENFRVTFEVPQMASKASVDNLLAGVAAENFEPNVIVIDTFARSFVGLDENSQKDTGLWVESADRLRQLGFTVIFLHHTAKNTEFGLKYRGSTAIMGAMDTAFTLQKEANKGANLISTKQKDHDGPAPIYFQPLKVSGREGTEGSIVLIPSMRMDERFTAEGEAKEDKVKAIIDDLLEDPTYESDRSRARTLADKAGISLGAAQTRISRIQQRSKFSITGM